MRAGSAHDDTTCNLVKVWRTSSRSGSGGNGANCVEVGAWRVSTYSTGGGNGAACVEVGAWRTSSRSGGGSNGANCVEVGAHSGCGTSIAVRDTKHRTGGMLSLDHTEWLGLTAAVKSGDLDA